MELETIKYQIMLSKSQNNRIKFSLKQQQAYNSIKKGNSIFVTGSAGVGKSQLIKTFIEENKDYMLCKKDSNKKIEQNIIQQGDPK